MRASLWTAKQNQSRSRQVAAEQRSTMHGRGPAHATVQALTRLRWTSRTARHWTTDEGLDLDLATVCPHTVHVLLRMAVERVQWRIVATMDGLVDLAVGAVTDSAWSVLEDTFSLEISGSLQELTLYVEGPAAGVDLLVDDVQVQPACDAPLAVVQATAKQTRD